MSKASITLAGCMKRSWRVDIERLNLVDEMIHSSVHRGGGDGSGHGGDEANRKGSRHTAEFLRAVSSFLHCH